jgi:predicted metal-dependent phosphoesterase TrpH
MQAFELHCHSIYSKNTGIKWEGIAKPRDIIRIAKIRGLDGIALTDHNTIKGWKEAEKEAKKQDIIFIPGIELSTQNGHVIALGISEHIPNNLPLDDTLDAIWAQGGIAVAPHPFDIFNNGIKHAISKVDAVETFNALALDRFSNLFCTWKAAKLGLPTVSGSDAHTLEMIGLAKNLISANDMDSVLREIKKGNVIKETNYISLFDLLEWMRERFIRSYNDVIKQTYNYWKPKGIIARLAINHFIKNSSSKFWSGMADIGLVISIVYSGFKILTY